MIVTARKQTGWRKGVTVITLTVASLCGLWAATPASVATPACRFVHYYQAIEKTDRSVSFWERVVYSLLLANTASADSCERPTRS